MLPHEENDFFYTHWSRSACLKEWVWLCFMLSFEFWKYQPVECDKRVWRHLSERLYGRGVRAFGNHSFSHKFWLSLYSSTAPRGDMVVPQTYKKQWWSDFVNRVAFVSWMSGMEMLYSWSASFIDECIWLKCHEKCPDKFSGDTSDLIQRNQLNGLNKGWAVRRGGWSRWVCRES